MELVEIARQNRSREVWVMREPHIHSEVEVNFVSDGTMTYRFGGELVTLDAGMLALFWGMVPHQTVVVAPSTRYVCLYLSLPSVLAVPLDERFKRALIDGHMLVAAGADSLDGPLFSRWHNDLDSGDARRVGLARAEVTARIRRVEVDGWRDLSANNGSRPAAVDTRQSMKAQAMARYIALHLDRPLAIGEIAGAVGLHPNYAMNVFKVSFGVTLHQYVTRQRLGHAQAMLLATDQPVTRIAFESGFGSLSRFYDAFGRRFGEPPEAYRRRQRSAPRYRLPGAA